MGNNKLNAYAARMKEGDEEAFALLYESTKKGVFSFVYSVTRDYEVSEELMQETYVRVKQNIRSYREGNFSAWLLMIARNLAYNHVRRAKRETPLPENPPEREYRMEEDGTPVLDAVKAVLGEEEGQIVVLHAVGGYKHREIAKMLNKPLGTVTWTYKNALEKLRKYLEEEGKR